ncbi:hypothetical protein IU486_19780 [Streptomyces gardneri]|nr:hypothetical protein [Streptomyces gardneri]
MGRRDDPRVPDFPAAERGEPLKYFSAATENRRLDAEARRSLRGSYIRSSDGIAHYELTGREGGDIVVLTGGLMIPLSYWDAVAAALHARGLRTLAYSGYGRGYSHRVQGGARPGRARPEALTSRRPDRGPAPGAAIRGGVVVGKPELPIQSVISEEGRKREDHLVYDARAGEEVTGEAWFPPEDDVHLWIWVADTVFDYTATAAAARNLVHDWARKHWCTVGLTRDAIEDRRALPRLSGHNAIPRCAARYRNCAVNALRLSWPSRAEPLAPARPT